MAVGLSPKYTEDHILEKISKEHFSIAAHEAFIKLGWKILYASPNGFIAYTNRKMFSSNAEIRVTCIDGIMKVVSASTGNEIADFGKNKKNVQAFMDAFNALLPAISSDEVLARYEILKQHFPPGDQPDVLLEPPVSGFKTLLALFIPVKGYFITPILIFINIAVFILMVCSGINFIEPDAESMLLWGANFKPITLNGEWYRLFTNCFLHFGILHLLLNMYALAYIGVLLEPRLGKSRFLSGYIMSGLLASIASLWYNDFVVSAGASGAIFGMYGVFLALLSTNMIEKSVRKDLLTSIGIFVVLNLFNGFAQKGIDNAAHIGGLAGGLIIGFLFIPGLLKPRFAVLKFGAIAAAALLTLGVCAAVYNAAPNDLAQYDLKIKQFAETETKALSVYQMAPSLPKEKMLATIKDVGIANWDKNLKLVKELDTLDLPQTLHDQNIKLEKYCALRLESYGLMYKTINEDTRAYSNRIAEINTEIEALIKELSGNNAPTPPSK